MSHLIQAQRYTIEALLTQGYKQKDIAAAIGKHKSVVSRRICRNCDERNGKYRENLAQSKCEKRLSKKPQKVYFTQAIWLMVEKRLADKLCPEQIIGESKNLGLTCVSVECIYQSTYEDKKNLNKISSPL